MSTNFDSTISAYDHTDFVSGVYGDNGCLMISKTPVHPLGQGALNGSTIANAMCTDVNAEFHSGPTEEAIQPLLELASKIILVKFT